LGLDVDNILEVTDCFPLPEEAADDTNYQVDMMRCLREVNVDNNTVGWYQPTTFGCYETMDLVEVYSNYSESINSCVCLVYDPARASLGASAFKAVKLRADFLKAYKKETDQKHKKLTAQALHDAGVTWHKIFEEVPLVITNSTLVTALKNQIVASKSISSQSDVDRLSLSTAPFLEKNVSYLNDCLADLFNEQLKVSTYHQNVAKQQQLQATWLKDRKAENMKRRANGKEPLNEDPRIEFKPVSEVGHLDEFLIHNQVANYCDKIDTFSKVSIEKLSVVKALNLNE